MRLTRSPRASSRQPMEAAARPFPNEDTTPPVTKMYLADISATSLDDLEVCAWCARLSIAGLGGLGKWKIRARGLMSRNLCGLSESVAGGVSGFADLLWVVGYMGVAHREVVCSDDAGACASRHPDGVKLRCGLISRSGPVFSGMFG